MSSTSQIELMHRFQRLAEINGLTAGLISKAAPYVKENKLTNDRIDPAFSTAAKHIIFSNPAKTINFSSMVFHGEGFYDPYPDLIGIFSCQRPKVLFVNVYLSDIYYSSWTTSRKTTTSISCSLQNVQL